MYRISKDIRVHQSSQALFKAIESLLQMKTLDQIGIKEVCDLADVGRSTFYRNFDLLEDVIRFEIRNRIMQVQDAFEPNSTRPLMGIVPHFLDQWTRHKDILSLINQHNLWWLFQDEFIKHAGRLVSTTDLPVKLSDTEKEYLATNMISRWETLLRFWASRGYTESTEELVRLFRLPFELRKDQRKNLNV